MLAFARSTLGELQHAINDDSDEEEEEVGDEQQASPSRRTTGNQPASLNIDDVAQTTQTFRLDTPPGLRPTQPLAEWAPVATEPALDDDRSATQQGDADVQQDGPTRAALPLGGPAQPITATSLVDGLTVGAANGPSEMPSSTLHSTTRDLEVARGDFGPLLAALQGAEVVPPATLTAQAAEARLRYTSLLALPELAELLQSIPAAEVGDWSPADQVSVPRIASQCAEALRVVAPRVLVAEAGGDAQRLLGSFSERYDALLRKHDERCKQYEAEKQSYSQELARKIEELVVQNSDLKEQVHALQKQRAGQTDLVPQLQRALQQRDTELETATGALKHLQEVMDDTVAAANTRCVDLEQDLVKQRKANAELEAGRRANADTLRETQEVAKNAAAQEAALLERCRAAEREALDCNAALEGLLQEKERRMEEQEHLVDRRLVTSMLVLHMDHMQSGQRELAEQVLNQTLQVLGGGASEQAERERLRAAAASAEPLGDAFLDFLTREAGGEDNTKAEHEVTTNGHTTHPTR